MKNILQEKKDVIRAFLSKPSWWEMRFIHALLLSSRLTENLAPGMVTPTLPEPESRRRQDGQMVV